MIQINVKKLLQLGRNGDWLGVDRMINLHLSGTNYNLKTEDSFYNPSENVKQFDYDNQLNNALGLGTDSALNTQQDKYDYLEFKLEEANQFI